MSTSSSSKKVGLGPTGEAVSRNVARLRGGMQYKQLAERLAELGRPIPTLGLRRIEDGERRVDADDLVALAIALGVTPNTLLFPHVDDGDSVAITGADGLSLGRVWRWAEGSQPLAGDERIDRKEWVTFLERTSPRFLGRDAAELLGARLFTHEDPDDEASGHGDD